MKLTIPKGIRPTSSKVKEAIFSVLVSLGLDFEGIECLDFFAGSGALGFEALVRGASTLTAVDSSFESCKAIKENAAKYKLEDKTKVIKSNALKINLDKDFDLVFADPPYDLADPDVTELFKVVKKVLKPEGIFVFEFSSKRKINWQSSEDSLELLSQKIYGDTVVYFFRSS
ncbi:MAG: RsmD family RNA methyltransferase [Candidatus Caenarcaniphilales bacterium]|nr:RsmD family RNA methyltransferase [Candidatus Caenarcaniphilales bacterium]